MSSAYKLSRLKPVYGQAVIEYIGCIAIASVLLASVLIIWPTAVRLMVSDILGDMPSALMQNTALVMIPDIPEETDMD